MNPFFKLLKGCWTVLNFVRNLVMNAVFILFTLCLLTFIGLFAASKSHTLLSGDQGALLLNLDGYLADNREMMPRWQDELLRLDNRRVAGKISTFDVVYAIENAKDDERIRGLVLDLNYFEGGDLPSLEYIGQAIRNFKESTKPVIVYADNYSQGQYFLASFADQIYLNGLGVVDIHGLRQETLYYKELLDNLAVEPHVFRVGTYKAAVEPFLRNDMSPQAKANAQKWLSGMWQHYQQTVMANRHITSTQLLPAPRQYIAELKALRGDETAYVKQRQLVTNFATRLEVDDKLRELFGKDEEGAPKLLAYEDYLDALPDRLESQEQAQNLIAVVNVEGAIIDGDSDSDNVGGDSVVTLLRKAYDEPRVKAVVLRINSPGGSAFASELIRQETENLQKAGKPVVVSMGGMAASGGYWIASTADYIMADKNTITGSIGIFALAPTFENSIKKWGVYADGVSTGELAESSAFSPMNKSREEIYQLAIENGYQRFLNIVSRGRQILPEAVDKIAQGQVWLGSDALKLGLVDELGDFDAAVEKAGELVNQQPERAMEDFSVEWLVEEDDSWLGRLDRRFKEKSQSYLVEWFGLPNVFTQAQRPLSFLRQFNDPQGQYLYCLSCGKLN